MQYLLSVAGYDPTGGAGVIRDIITFRKHGFYGLGVITAITYQNPHGFYGMISLSPEEVKMQLEPLIESFSINYVKIGMLGKRGTAELLARMAQEYEWFVVFDPLLAAKNSHPLNARDDIELLLRRANVITPNVPEAEAISGKKIENEETLMDVGKMLREKYGGYVIIKGGHLNGTDYLFGEEIHTVSLPLLRKNMHGTGCVYSSTLLSKLVSGKTMEEAFRETRAFVQKEIENSIETGGYSLPP